MSSETVIRKAIETVCTDPENYDSEDRFQAVLSAELGDAPRELMVTFDAPPIEPKTPSADDIRHCTERGLKLSPFGKDPCDGRMRRLDILWNDIPIELKSVVTVKADVNGYDFLKDIHRLERLSGVATGTVLSDTRFAVFVSADAQLWQRRLPRAPNIYEGRSIKPGHWVQYQQKSPVTRWHGYPPFYLAGSYKLEWSALPNGAKYLLVEVRKHAKMGQ